DGTQNNQPIGSLSKGALKSTSTSCLEGLDHKTYRIHKLCVDQQQRVVPICQMDYPSVESAIRRATIMQPIIVVIVFPVNAIILVAAQLFVKHPSESDAGQEPGHRVLR